MSGLRCLRPSQTYGHRFTTTNQCELSTNTVLVDVIILGSMQVELTTFVVLVARSVKAK